ncbi:hypothetical protein NAPIS_ORF00367 [Vairimorpha apis BRL 01]|uniref:Uncharacterized protein n=1 Tax=Vairimorpha apis BRL 01 TaxID=1037528 RepID=T0L3J7_9MICR|nr:hypothetical protein NAPIS_ORF00367 [Vairimorpha apis BRL 01]
MYVQLKNVNDKLTDNIKSSIKKNDILLELLKRNIDDNYTEQSSFDDNKKEEKGINKIIYESNVESCQNLEGLKYQSENNVILKNFLPHSEDNELYDLLCNIEKNCEFVVDSFCKINEQEKNGENVKENDDKNNINLENENLEIVDENKLELKIKENNINLEDENLEIVDGNKIDLKIEKNCEENNVKLKNEHLENFDENNLNTDEIYSDFKVKQIENIDENLDKISSKKKNLKEFIFNDEFIDDILINETPNEQLLNSSSSESTSSSIKSKDLEILKNLLQENKK